MKKSLIFVVILFIGTAGFLAYDWYAKTMIQSDDQRITFYSWTDEKGAKHYTNTQPPDGVKNIEESKGYKFIDQPLVFKIKDKTTQWYQWIKEKLFNT